MKLPKIEIFKTVEVERTENERIVRFVMNTIFLLVLFLAFVWWISLPVEFEADISINNQLMTNILISTAPHLNLTATNNSDGVNAIHIKGKVPMSAILGLR